MATGVQAEEERWRDWLPLQAGNGFCHARLWWRSSRCSACWWPHPPNAQQARHVTINVEDTFVDDFWTETCGTTVVISVEGTLHVTLLYNEEGLIEKEIDPSSGLTVTFSAPLMGNSFSFPANTVIFDYGAGAEVGSTFTGKSVGLFGHVPGLIASDAGQLIFTGVVEGFDEFGIPQLEFTEVLVQHGNFESQEDINAAVCGALTA